MVARDIRAYHVIKGIKSLAVIECECDTLYISVLFMPNLTRFFKHSAPMVPNPCEWCPLKVTPRYQFHAQIHGIRSFRVQTSFSYIMQKRLAPLMSPWQHPIVSICLLQCPLF